VSERAAGAAPAPGEVFSNRAAPGPSVAPGLGVAPAAKVGRSGVAAAPEHCLLLSGGVDSATVAAWIKEHHPGEPVRACTFLYGQKHAVELEAARAVAAAFGMQHEVVAMAPIHGSALTDVDAPLPEGRDLDSVTGVAPSYVPARNLLFLAHMALWLGVHHDDHTGYPDCRPEFVQAADQAVRLGTQYELRVQAPFVHWSKAEVVRWGLAHGVPYELTHSCYQGRRPACGVCDTCQVRLQAFAAAGVVDPIAYETGAGPRGAAGQGGTSSPCGAGSLAAAAGSRPRS
jgi:7-cyano-7-deazaguanine synthase